jgi:hypothetical protein
MELVKKFFSFVLEILELLDLNLVFPFRFFKGFLILNDFLLDLFELTLDFDIASMDDLILLLLLLCFLEGLSYVFVFLLLLSMVLLRHLFIVSVQLEVLLKEPDDV